MRIFTAEQMQAADRHAIDEIGIPSLVLMENAGSEIVRAIDDAFGDPAELAVLVLCGMGSNGGDGMVVARKLFALGCDVRALLLGDPALLKGDAAHQWRVLSRIGVPAEACDEEAWDDEAVHLAFSDVIVDAILGTGFRGRLQGFLAQVVNDVNDCPVPVVAVDVPSGLSGSSSDAGHPAVEASLTVALQAPKICHVFAPAGESCGDVAIVDIGIPDASLRAAGSGLELVEEPEVALLLMDLADRPAASHKGRFGHVLAVGGSMTHSGAIALAGIGALRGGAGLVTVASPEPCVPVVAAHAPELMHAPLRATPDGAIGDAPLQAALLERKSAVVAGPGMGTGDGAARLLREVLGSARVPVVLDADALNLLALHGLPSARADRPLVLTPHPGELARLARALGAEEPGEDQLSRISVARELARRVGGVVVLKGFRTLVVGAAEDDVAQGARPIVRVIPTGGPGLATGGTGDVLAGLAGALLAQGLRPIDAATAAAFVHGRAGDLAEDTIGQMGMSAGDIATLLPAAIESLFGEDDEADLDDPDADADLPDDSGEDELPDERQ